MFFIIYHFLVLGEVLLEKLLHTLLLSFVCTRLFREHKLNFSSWNLTIIIWLIFDLLLCSTWSNTFRSLMIISSWVLMENLQLIRNCIMQSDVNTHSFLVYLFSFDTWWFFLLTYHFAWVSHHTVWIWILAW